MLVTHTERPRELRWYHAGPMLYGDWGTSRFYVLGLAFYYTLHASFWYVLGVGAIVACVGWAYTVICKCYPDGGGVYSAARHTSQQLAVVGALLLFADYIVTAAISAYSGMQYLQLTNNTAALAAASSALIALIGVINYVGAKKAGTFALIVALATLILTLILACFAVPHLAAGWHNIVSFKDVPGSAPVKWDNLVRVILALSGVEAVANMTGIMVPPVKRTSKKSIYPVLFEVVALNLLFAVAMNALPDAGTRPAFDYEAKAQPIKEKYSTDWDTNPRAIEEFRANGLEIQRVKRDDDIENTVMRVMATEYVHPWFGTICGIVFAFLLFSAVNTAVMDMISIQYVMSRDRELPKFLQKLNRFGVPWTALVPAVVLPVVMVCAFPDLVTLGDLYAIGVIGAITINLGSCCVNKKMPLKRYERVAMGMLAAILLGVEATLVVEKPKARWFALGVLAVGLTLRYAAKAYPKWKARRAAARVAAEVRPGAAATEERGLADLGTPAGELDMTRPKVLVATRGVPTLIDFAIKYTRHLNGVLMLMFVREVNVLMLGSPAEQPLEEDREALAIFRRAYDACLKAGVPLVPIYVISPDVGYAILDQAATYNAMTVMLGVSRRGALLKALKGDVLREVSGHLPEHIQLIVHA